MKVWKGPCSRSCELYELCGEHTTNIGSTECSVCRRTFRTIKDLQNHLSKIGHVCHEPGCKYKFGPCPKRPRLQEQTEERPHLEDQTEEVPVYSNTTAPWPSWLPKKFRCLVDLQKLELNGADHRFILKHGLNLEQCKLRYREYYVERLPVLISGNDKPETTDEEYYYDSDVSEERSFEQYYANCSCTLQNPCEKCKEIKEKILKSSSEESEGEDNDNGGTPNLSLKESESDYDTDWDDPHNGQHPNCTDCEDIRADECQDTECTEHGTGDTEGYEDPPEEPPEAYESLPNKDDNDETPIDSEEAEEIINVIEQLQKESEMANSLAKDAIKNLKATNYTTQAIKNHLEKEMIKQEHHRFETQTGVNSFAIYNIAMEKLITRKKKLWFAILSMVIA